MSTPFDAPAQLASTTHPLAGSVAALIGLVPLLPLLGAVINGTIAITSQSRARATGVEATTARHPVVSIVGPGVILAAFALAMAVFVAILRAAPVEAPYVVSYGQWLPSGSLVIEWALQLDQLSMLMTLVITGVGALIHIFSVGYMRADAGYARYFAYLNLFVSFMLILVLGASYPVLFVGWEGVGLCSYLLIGFWFSDRANVEAGKKAFVVNRIGDVGLLIAMFLMWSTVQRVDFVGVHTALAAMAGSPVVRSIALLLFLGCVGKSAQIPLYLWLPDAMAGPTPVSALIHAATMVTAGVYLVARAAPVFAGAPDAALLVTLVGGTTALFAATIALRQWDIKKVLAYSTVSQLGYMFIAVGSGAYAAGVFHLVTHAFFKALLFLGAGSVIHAMHGAYHHAHRDDDPQDLRNMGGLARYLPATAISMAIASLAIAGIPPFAGFFSKDEILTSVFARAHESPLARASLLGVSGSAVLYVVYALGVVTALLTAIYMTRLMMLAFTGANRTGVDAQPGLHEAPASMTAPVLALAALTVVGGWLNLPALLPVGPTGLLEHWLEPVTGASAARLAGGTHLSAQTEWMLVAIAIGTSLAGMAYAGWRYRSPLTDKAHAPADTGIAAVLTNAYGVDARVDALVVRPFMAFATRGLSAGAELGLDRAWSAGASFMRQVAVRWGARVQDGEVGKYAWLMAAGVIAVLASLSLAR